MSSQNQTSPGQVMQNVYDEATQSLRTNTSVTAIGEVNVELNAVDGDNVAIANGADIVTVTTVGLDKGLDINVIGGIGATEVTLVAVNAKLNSLGQKTMSAAMPVVLSSDQSPTPTSSVSSTIGAQRYRKETISSETFEGYNNNLSAADTDSTWQISRTTIVGNNTLKEWANNALFTSQWTNRVSYFGAVPFNNSKSIVFDGVNDYIAVPHNTSLNFSRSQPFSFSAWCKSITPASTATIASKFTGGFGYEITHDTSGRVEINFQGGSTGNRIRIRKDTNTLLDGLWHQVTITYSGSSAASGMKVYMDGLNGSSTTLNDTLTIDPTSLANLGIATSSTGGVPRFAGFMDEMAFWNVELTAAAVAELYAATGNIDLGVNTGNYTQSLSLISWWRMGDGDIYPIITDNKSSNDGTLTNAVPGSINEDVP